MNQSDMLKIINDCTKQTLEINKDNTQQFIKDFIDTNPSENPYELMSKFIVAFSERYLYLSAANTLSILNALGLFDPENHELLSQKPSLKVVYDADSHSGD